MPPTTGDILFECFRAPGLLGQLCALEPDATAQDLATILAIHFPGISASDPVVIRLLADLQNVGLRIWLQGMLTWLHAHPMPTPPRLIRTTGGSWQPTPP